jgi:hypothetical protein
MHSAGLAAGVVVVADSHAGQVLDTTGEVLASLQDFFAKWKSVSDQLGFVVHAVDAIAEVCSFPRLTETMIHYFVAPPLRQDRLECDLLYSDGRMPLSVIS